MSIESLESRDVPKFADLFNAFRSATIYGKTKMTPTERRKICEEIQRLEAALKSLKQLVNIAEASEVELISTAQQTFGERVVEIVCRFYRITPEELRSKSREHRFAFPRRVASFLIWNHSPTPRPLWIKVGEFIGRDGETARWGERTLISEMKTFLTVAAEVEVIRNSLITLCEQK